jgi:NADH-quinone oxidoreductase subunit B
MAEERTTAKLKPATAPLTAPPSPSAKVPPTTATPARSTAVAPLERTGDDGEGGGLETTDRIDATGSSEGSFLLSTVQSMANWCRKNSVWPLPLGLSCCGIEFMAVAASRYDMARFGMEVARFSPRQADLLLVAGTLTYKMAHVMTRLYDQMAEPKWVIAMGACASSGGMFRSYPVVQGIDEFIPVDFYIPGCPPRPDAVLECLLQLQKKIERDRTYRLELESGERERDSLVEPVGARWRGAEPAPVALAVDKERFVEPGPQKRVLRNLPLHDRS